MIICTSSMGKLSHKTVTSFVHCHTARNATADYFEERVKHRLGYNKERLLRAFNSNPRFHRNVLGKLTVSRNSFETILVSKKTHPNPIAHWSLFHIWIFSHLYLPLGLAQEVCASLSITISPVQPPHISPLGAKPCEWAGPPCRKLRWGATERTGSGCADKPLWRAEF